MSGVAGKVYLVGAGPGDPGLLTRRGAAVLALADVVVYDHLASARLLDLAPSEAVRICAGKSIGHCTLSQDEISKSLIEHAQAGLTVVRLKGGDPLVFGRGGEEASALRAAAIPFEIVPGVSAGFGVPAYAGIPVTHRGASSAVAFVTGHDDPEAELDRNVLDWAALARFPGTLVVYMCVTNLASICRSLIRLGKPADTPAALVEAGTTPSQRTWVATLETIAADAARDRASPPALLIVGSVIALRDTMMWYEQLPLFGQRIVITRPKEESERSAAILEALGAEVLLAPTVALRAITDPRPLDDAIERLAHYDWLVFTSSAGVRFFLERLAERGRDLRALGQVKLAAIGPTTAEALAQFHLKADLVPDSYRSEALAEALQHAASGRRILLARADRGRTLLLDVLRGYAEVDQVAVYHNADADALPDAIVQRLVDGSLDWVTLTSSAIATRLHDLLPEVARQRIGRDIRLASLSPVTSETIARLGWTVGAEARNFTWEGLVESLIEQVADDRRHSP